MQKTRSKSTRHDTSDHVTSRAITQLAFSRSLPKLLLPQEHLDMVPTAGAWRGSSRPRHQPSTSKLAPSRSLTKIFHEQASSTRRVALPIASSMSQRHVESEKRPKPTPASVKVRVSGMNSQLAAFCEEERARFRRVDKTSSSTSRKSPSSNSHLSNPPTSSADVWLAFCVLVSAVWALVYRQSTWTLYTRTCTRKHVSSHPLVVDVVVQSHRHSSNEVVLRRSKAHSHSDEHDRKMEHGEILSRHTLARHDTHAYFSAGMSDSETPSPKNLVKPTLQNRNASMSSI